MSVEFWSDFMSREGHDVGRIWSLARRPERRIGVWSFMKIAPYQPFLPSTFTEYSEMTGEFTDCSDGSGEVLMILSATFHKISAVFH